MHPIIPFEFDPPAISVEEHLTYSSYKNGVSVCWPLIDAQLRYRKAGSEVEHFDALHIDNPTFRLHAASGFSIGTYHEFVIQGNGPCWGYTMGGVETTIGPATPLAAQVFDPFYREKWFGEWDYLQSVRIVGAAMQDAELGFANAAIRYANQFQRTPALLDFAYPFDWEEQEEVTPSVTPGPPMISQIEPLRFFYNGLVNQDPTARCVAFYRVIEYFSFYASQKDFTQLRYDTDLSDAGFVKKILEIVTKDEKGPILKLVNIIADPEIVARAAELGLLGDNGKASLGEEIYKFRNSIVHGKHSFGYELFSPSLFQEETSSHLWQEILRELARAALQAYGLPKG